MRLMSKITERANFDFIRYANCWEDPELLIEALHPIENESILSIASAGDNSFSLLTAHPKIIVAVDFNPVQLACVDIRKAAFKMLTYEELLQFMGIHECSFRLKLYDKIKPSCQPTTIHFWDSQLTHIQLGIIHAGKFESYLKLFGTKLLPWIHNKKTILELLEIKSLFEQDVFYHKKWNTFLWRGLFKVFFSKWVMGKMGRDPEFFKYTEKSPGEVILERTQHALTKIPTHRNPYLRYILTGNFSYALPHYLRKENFEIIKSNLDKLVTFHGGVQEAMGAYPHTFTRFNLSDIFEYMSFFEFQSLSNTIFEKSGSTAKVAYWNLLAYRNMNQFPNEWRTNMDFSHELHQKDQAWFYSQFFISELLND